MIDNIVAAVFAWALRKPAVQEVICIQFEQTTPMCDLLRYFIAAGIKDHERSKEQAS